MPPRAAADCAFEASVVVATELLADELVPPAGEVPAGGLLVPPPPLPLLLQAASARLAATVATEIATQC
jgi:hypothetical protein